MIIDMHAHSSGISTCCLVPYDAAIRAARDVGLDGIVLTNHYTISYVVGDAAAFAEEYVNEFRLAKAYGDEIGMKVFFGIEVTMEQYGGAHLLLYGVPEDFPKRYPELYDMTLAELRPLVKQHGGAMIQAHPYRRKKNLLDVAYLDGVEVNCHPQYGKSDSANMVAIAEENDLILTCGGDYHADTYRPHCGTFLPDDMTGEEIGAYLIGADSIKLRIHEPKTETAYDYTYRRPRA